MGKIYEEIDAKLTHWIEKQRVFFVATAPLAKNGHVNCSPKGGDCLRIVDGHTVIYEDYIGSGAETIAHIRENSRIVIMFVALNGPPKILRLHGTARVHLPGDDPYREFVASFASDCAGRSIIEIAVSRIQDSCGFGVPLYEHKGERDSLARWSNSKTDQEKEEYKRLRNAQSIDGLPALEVE